MALDRETLAAQVFVMCVASCEFATEKLVKWAFDQADVFLAYAEKQRKQPEPEKPDHCEYCGKDFQEGDGHDRLMLGSMKVLACPKHPHRPQATFNPAPKREPREWWLYRDRDNKRWEVKDSKPVCNWEYVIKCVEVPE